jgi:tRNA(Ile)-lysidine synthase
MDWPLYPADAPRDLLLGFSGGRDSTALLHRLAAWCADGQRQLRAVHVDHGLHACSGDWAAHCVAVAGALGVPCAVHRVTVRRDGRGLEDAARHARYRAFAEERRHGECLVLAHHRDDQAETLLLALLRGSGERGLSAMRDFTVDARGPIWRPLLSVPAADIARYAEAHALSWIDDPSNADTRLARNALRNVVLPTLRRHEPTIDAALVHSAKLLAEADAELSRSAARDLAGLQGLAGDTLDLPALRRLPRSRATRALRLWADTRGAALTRDAIARVLDDWARHPAGRALRHPLGRHALRQWGDALWLTPASAAAIPTAASPPWSGAAPLDLPDGGTLRLLGADRLDAALRLVPRAAAPRAFRAAGDRHSRPLKTAFAALGVPPWARDEVPLLVDPDGALQALGDLAYGAKLDDGLRARGARLVWQPGAAGG